MHVTAVIPAKGRSARLTSKNLLPFPDADGPTLVGHKIDQLLRCQRIDAVVVGSDDDGVLHEARRHGAIPRKRDAYHCDEQACPLRERWRNLVAQIETDLVVWAHCTNPLVGSDLYDDAIGAYLDALDRCDSLASVTRIQRHAWLSGVPHGWNPWADEHPFASDLEPFYFQDGAIFIQPHRQMLENGYFFGQQPLLYQIDAPYGWDIDTPQDYETACLLYRALYPQKEAA